MKTRIVFFLTAMFLFAAALAQAQSADFAVRQQLQSKGSVVNVLMNAKGLPSFIRCDLDYSSSGSGAVERAWTFLDDNATIFGMMAPHEELTLDRQQTDEHGTTHLKFNQFYRGIPVFAGQVFVHVNVSGHITSVNGNYVPHITLDTQPSITLDHAKNVMAQRLGKSPRDCRYSRESLMIMERKDGLHLAWSARAQSDVSADASDFFVDARTGEILARYSLVRE
jgi:Zn-dependent metalloprotease